MATPTARLPLASISRAVVSAAFLSRSAIAIFAPSRAKTRAISLPMPLAAPVTTATLSLRHMGISLTCRLASGQVVVNHLAELEGEVGEDVRAGHDLEHRQFGKRRKGVREQGELGRPGPRSLQIDIGEIVLDQLADACRAVDVRNDLEQEIGRQQGSFYGCEIRLLVLVSHRADGDRQGSVVQPADQRVDFRLQRRLRELLGKAPELAPAGDGRMVVDKHAMGVAALAALERDRDHLSALGVVAEAGRIWHANEFEFDQRLLDLERLRNNLAQLPRISAVGDDEKLTMVESIWSDRISRTRQWHRERPLAHFTLFHRFGPRRSASIVQGCYVSL